MSTAPSSGGAAAQIGADQARTAHEVLSAAAATKAVRPANAGPASRSSATRRPGSPPTGQESTESNAPNGSPAAPTPSPIGRQALVADRQRSSAPSGTGARYGPTTAPSEVSTRLPASSPAVSPSVVTGPITDNRRQRLRRGAS